MRSFWLVLLAALLPVAALAQETRGNISGRVRDSGGVIPAAAVTITSVDTNVSQSLVTRSASTACAACR